MSCQTPQSHFDDRRGLEVVGRVGHIDAEPGARVRRMVTTFQHQELLARLITLVGSRSE